MMFTMKPELRESCRESPLTMAQITTEALFEEVDTNGDRVLTLDEFRAWFNRDTQALAEL